MIGPLETWILVGVITLSGGQIVDATFDTEAHCENIRQAVLIGERNHPHYIIKDSAAYLACHRR